MQYSKYNTKGLVQAGIISAIIIVLVLFCNYIPLFSLVGIFVLPIPVTVLYVKQNYKLALGSVIVSAILSSMLYNPLVVLNLVIIYGIVGMILGYCISKEKSSSTTLFILSVGFFIVIILELIFNAFIVTGQGIVSLYSNTIKTYTTSMQSTANFYTKMGASQQQLQQINNTIKQLNSGMILYMLPALIIIGACVYAFLYYKITGSILKKLKFNVKPIKPFCEFYIDNRLGAMIIIILCIGVIMQSRKISGSQYVIYSALSIFQFAFMINGVATVAYYFMKKLNLSKGVTIFIVLLTIFTPINYMYTYLGVGEMIFNFRRLDPYGLKLR